jgi:sodium-dependent dicarboxylate transporter 2/3/5
MQKEIRGLLMALLGALLCYALSLLFLSDLHSRALAAVFFLLFLWTNEALPIGVVSLLPIILFPALGLLDTSKTAANYANGIVFLFLGGFMLSIAVEKTELHRLFARKLLTLFPPTPKGVIFALASASAILSAFLSNTTTALLLLPLAHFLASQNALKTRLALAIAFGSSIGGIITPIGTPPNLILIGFLHQHSLAAPHFIGWIAMMLPLATAMILVLAFILSINTSGLTVTYQISVFSPASSDQKRLGAIILMLGAILLLNNWLRLDERTLILFFGLLMFFPKIGFLEWQESRQIPYDIFFLMGAGFALADLFNESKFAELIAESLTALTGQSDLVVMIAVISAISVIGLALNNTTKASIAYPIVFSVAQSAELDAALFLLVAAATASFSFILPTSTPPNAVALSSKAVKIKEMIIYGSLMTLVGALLVVLSAFFYWKWF